MLTKQEIFEEYGKCLMDYGYAIETYLKTFDKTQEGFVPFKLFPKQKEIIQGYRDNRFNMVTKPRQAGVSTTTAAYAAIKVCFADPNNPEAVLVLANKQDMAFEFLAKIKDFILQVPRWVWGSEYYGTPKKEEKSIFLTESKKEIKLPNGSRIKAVATSKDALRGYTPTWLIMDEAAFIDDGDIVFGAALTALGTGGAASLISCVTEDTYIQTSKGLRQMSDLIDYNKPDNPDLGYYVDEYNILGKDKVRSSNILVNNGYQETIKLKTTFAELEGTKTHKLWVYDDLTKTYKWKVMGDLKVGDYVNIKYGSKIFGNDDAIDLNYTFSNKENKPSKIYTHIDENLAYLIGLYLSEGSVYKHYNKEGNHIGTVITITCGDDISKYITDAGFKFSSHDKLHHAISSKYLGSLLEYLGLDLSLHAPKKYIPNKLLSMSELNTKAMIRGFMDGDGYSDNIRGRIGLNISSKKMCLQFRQLLLNIGILTDYQEGVCPPTKLVKVSSKYYRLSATSIDAKRYYDEVGFSFKRKQIKEENLKEVNYLIISYQYHTH